ncbi:nitric oxide reductase activation protein NorD [Roseateles oligotrophus]|uniref:VWA domain-containing protein n=1 Tax=Roseateles oligotrophus TaxID=1769250 RepID=A0ABT2YB01_9BURK|nr:VWA domain-containing protein [Roseateles oligotrophus]MCV2367471.1 VWA domain-containing protein [Roseateles oligotrophus]
MINKPAKTGRNDMEEWIGQVWHRFVTRAADQRHLDAAVQLTDMRRSIGMLFRAAGGDAAVRLGEASATQTGGPRGWLQRLGGVDGREHLARLEPDVLSLPAQIAVFAEPELNRALYLWLAALSAVYIDSGDWLADNRAATLRALTVFPGLQLRYQQLLQAHLAQRPALSSLKGPAATAEAALRAALTGELFPLPGGQVLPQDLAPVWLWLLPGAGKLSAATARGEAANEARLGAKPGEQDKTRRQAKKQSEHSRQDGLLMFFRTESLLSWSEYVKVNRASDDDEDGNAVAAANDMQTLTVTDGGQTLAARVKFDLDLPSAAADDRPLGPGERLPEWDWRQRLLLPEHCSVQRFVNAEAPPFAASPALRQTARRMRRRLETLRAAPSWQRGMDSGEEIDLDAWVRYAAEGSKGNISDSPSVYARAAKTERSLASLLMADLSLSTDAYANNNSRIIDVIREALFVFGEALDGSGDPFEMLGFSSVRRQNIRIQHLKGFDEAWGQAPKARVGAIKPGYYTRMGAAIRHATARLSQRPERQRLLLLLTDGKPNDLDHYEGRFGLEDTRHAVQAARQAGLTPFCVTIDTSAHDYLPYLFGAQGYALVHRPQDLLSRLPKLYASLTRA